MSEPVNLNRFRKAKAKSAAKVEAAENRVKFGLTKHQKQLEAALRDKAASKLDSAKRDSE